MIGISLRGERILGLAAQTRRVCGVKKAGPLPARLENFAVSKPRSLFNCLYVEGSDPRTA